VRDRGKGIDPQDQELIFDRFGRAVSRNDYGGFGLGLWVVRRLAEALHGTARVESSPGDGSTFTIELPRTT
jgi:signal transduction histidine kinase